MEAAYPHLPDRPAYRIPDDPNLTLPAVATALRRMAFTASVIPVVAGVVVLTGWTFDIDVLTRGLDGVTAMNPTTALGFICAGSAIALSTLDRNRAPERWAAMVLALVVTLIGLVRLLGAIGLYDAGVDRMLFADKLPFADYGRPNRMAPNAAVNFILIGMALL